MVFDGRRTTLAAFFDEDWRPAGLRCLLPLASPILGQALSVTLFRAGS